MRAYYLCLLPFLFFACSGGAGGSGNIDRRVITASAVNGKGAVVTSDGHVMQFGSRKGSLADVPALQNVVSVEAGIEYFALRSDGTVVTWYHERPEEAMPIEGVQDVIAMSAAPSNAKEALFLRSDGTVIKAMRIGSAPGYKSPPISAGYVCGLGRCYEVVDGLSDAIEVNAVKGRYYILRSDHTVWRMEADDAGYQRSPGEPHAALTKVDGLENVASFKGTVLLTDGTIPGNFAEPITNVTAVDDGVVLTADGTLYSLINDEWVGKVRKPVKLAENVVQFDFEQTTLAMLQTDGTVKVAIVFSAGFPKGREQTALGPEAKVAMP